MPCWTVVTNTVDLEKVKDLALLGQVLAKHFNAQAIGSFRDRWRFLDSGQWIEVKDGKVTSQMDANSLAAVVKKINVAYSGAVVKAAAQRFGWRTTQKDATHFVVAKG